MEQKVIKRFLYVLVALRAWIQVRQASGNAKQWNESYKNDPKSELMKNKPHLIATDFTLSSWSVQQGLCNTLKTICVPIRHPKCRFDSYSWMKPQLSSQSLLQPADRHDSHRELGWTPAQSQDSWCFHFVLTVRFHVCIIMRYVSKLVLTNRFPRCLATNCTPEHAPPPSLQLYRCDVQCVFV